MAAGYHFRFGPQWRDWMRSQLKHFSCAATRISLPFLSHHMRALLVGALVSFLLLFITPIGMYLTLALAGLSVALLLQQIVDPTPLFWAAPGEAWQLIRSRKARGNHVWLHRTQALLRDALDSPRIADGFATSDGLVLMNVDLNEAQMLAAAEATWRDIVEDAWEERCLKGCKTVRLLVAGWFVAGGLLVLGVAQRFDVPHALVVVVASSAAGHALARPMERMLGRWAALGTWREEGAGLGQIVVEPVALSGFLWFKGMHGFWVRRVGGGRVGGDRRR